MNRAAATNNLPKQAQPALNRGLLVAGEGLDGCGKTTAMAMVANILREKGIDSVLSNWNEIKQLYDLTMRLNLAGELTPSMRLVLGAADLAARYHYVILPALQAGKVVLVTKYLLAALAHSLVRGQNRGFFSRVYEFALNPDLTIYFNVPVRTALERKLNSTGIGFWESGLDLGIDCPVESALDQFRRGLIRKDVIRQKFVDFQSQLADVYTEELGRFRATVIDATAPVEIVAQRAADAVLGIPSIGALSRGEPSKEHP